MVKARCWCCGWTWELSCFSEIPTYDKRLRRIFVRGTKSNQIHNSKTKTLFKDIERSYRFRSQQLASRCFIGIHRLQCMIALWALAVLLLFKTITLPSPETYKRSLSSGWVLHC